MNPDTILAWHFTNGYRLRDGSPLPPEGEWLRHRGPVRPCRSGLHASISLRDALRYAPGTMLHRVELRGDLQSHGASSYYARTEPDKYAGRERCIHWSIEAGPIIRAFARECALSVSHYLRPDTQTIWDHELALSFLRDRVVEDVDRVVMEPTSHRTGPPTSLAATSWWWPLQPPNDLLARRAGASLGYAAKCYGPTWYQYLREQQDAQREQQDAQRPQATVTIVELNSEWGALEACRAASDNALWPMRADITFRREDERRQEDLLNRMVEAARRAPGRAAAPPSSPSTGSPDG